MDQPILEFHGITKSFFGVCVLEDIRLALGRGQVLGLIGENGAGKSTLMNILGGVLPADAGHMTLGGRPYQPRSVADATAAGIAFIHQELNLFTNLSIADNLFIDRFPRLGGLPLISRRAAARQARDLLESVDLHLAPHTPVGDLAPGERQLVEIAKALSTGARVVIFDEPTTSLTRREADRLFAIIEHLRRRQRSVIYVSHILKDVRRLADTIAVLKDGRLAGAGPAAEFTIDRMISLMVGRDIRQLYPARAAAPSAEVLLAVRGLSRPGIVKDVSFDLHRGEVLGLFGLMGSGRSELARLLFGLEAPAGGTVRVRGRPLGRLAPAGRIARGLAFVTEDRHEEGLLMDAPILDNMGLAALRQYARGPLVRVLERRRLRRDVAALSERLRVRSGPVERHLARNLSGGNQQKVVLGKWLLSKPCVFLMDEPTRGIDVGAKADVYRLMNDLVEAGAGILFISSELEELVGLCDRILVVGNGQVQRRFARSEFDEEAILRAAFREHAAPGPQGHAPA